MRRGRWLLADTIAAGPAAIARTGAVDSSSLHHRPNSVLAVPALDDPPIPIGAMVTVHYDNREIDGELLGMALGRMPHTCASP